MSKCIALVGGTLIDGNGQEPINDSAVIISENKIVAVGTKSMVKIPADCQVVDVSGMTVMPGLMDAHIHMCIGHRDTTVGGGVQPGLAEPYAYRALISSQYCMEYMDKGITTLRDAGDFGGHVAISVRDAINQGVIAGPRIFACGQVLLTTV